jgi:two-component system chemotaxis response regulator CheB
MSKIRVLVVDDAVVVRRMLSDILAEDPAIEVAATAANGRLALAKLDQVSPDVVVLDVEMPEMDGLATLAEIRRTRPRLPVIMFSTLTERGAATTLDALALGASDYITKPTSAGGLDAARTRVRAELGAKIRALCGRAPRPAPAATAPLARPAARQAAPRLPGLVAARPAALVVGVSTGGPNALAALLPALPADFPLPVLVVQHMPPLFTRFLAERLASRAELRVAEGVDGEPVVPGRVYIAPGDQHMTLERVAGDGASRSVRLRLDREPPENSCRPAVDPLFRSAAGLYGAGTVALILTGMGHDGLRGCAAVREAGGRVLVQDEATSVVWGMPGSVAEAGLADRVLPLEAIGPELVRLARGGAGAGIPTARPLAAAAR